VRRRGDDNIGNIHLAHAFYTTQWHIIQVSLLDQGPPRVSADALFSLSSSHRLLCKRYTTVISQAGNHERAMS
jgi:hypothetical protein